MSDHEGQGAANRARDAADKIAGDSSVILEAVCFRPGVVLGQGLVVASNEWGLNRTQVAKRLATLALFGLSIDDWERVSARTQSHRRDGFAIAAAEIASLDKATIPVGPYFGPGEFQNGRI